MNINHLSNINILNDYLLGCSSNIDYCGISNTSDFNNYETVIKFKYKIINTKKQFSKICDFISDYYDLLDYDWYIKVRPDIKLLEPINFYRLSDISINARARLYVGPQRIKYGMSVNGEGCWKYIGDCTYNEFERDLILDDMFFIFHHNVIKMGAFNKILYSDRETEWNQTYVWKARNIQLNIIGIFLKNTKYNCFSGHLNIEN